MTMVTNGLQSRRARKKAATRSQIIAAAVRLFSEHGIEAVTVDQIAAAAMSVRAPSTTTSRPRKTSSSLYG
jgi:AcrR family transcriptional regulator